MPKRYTEGNRHNEPWLTPEALAVCVSLVMVAGLFIALVVGGRRSQTPAACPVAVEQVPPCR